MIAHTRRLMSSAQHRHRRSLPALPSLLPVFPSLALGPHPHRELTLMLRLGSACPRLSIAAGAPFLPFLPFLPFPAHPDLLFD
jgi:hypothetical protein